MILLHKPMTEPALLTFPGFFSLLFTSFKLSLMSLYFWKQSQLPFIIATFEGNLPFLALAIFKIFLFDFVNGFTLSMIRPCTLLFVVIPFLTHRDPWTYSLISFVCCTFSAIIPSDLVDAHLSPLSWKSSSI